MTNLKRSKSMDFTLSSRSNVLYPQYSKLKSSISYTNIDLKMIQKTDNSEEMISINSLTDTWIEEKNIEIRKAELQMKFLKDFQTHYYQQLDIVTENNRRLSNELLFNTNKLKMFHCAMNKETSRHKQFIDQLEYYKLVYNNLLVKNNALLENNQELLSENNIVVNEQNLILQNQKDLYRIKNRDLCKLTTQKKDLKNEKVYLDNKFKCTEISWERELKQLMNDKTKSKMLLKNELRNYRSTMDNIKTNIENIDYVLTTQDYQRQKRKYIINEIMQIEKVIQKRSQITTIIKETFKTLLEVIVDILKDF